MYHGFKKINPFRTFLWEKLQKWLIWLARICYEVVTFWYEKACGLSQTHSYSYAYMRKPCYVLHCGVCILAWLLFARWLPFVAHLRYSRTRLCYFTSRHCLRILLSPFLPPISTFQFNISCLFWPFMQLLILLLLFYIKILITLRFSLNSE